MPILQRYEILLLPWNFENAYQGMAINEKHPYNKYFVLYIQTN